MRERFEGATYNIVEEVEGDEEIDYKEDRRHPDMKVGLHEHIRVAKEKKTTIEFGFISECL